MAECTWKETPSVVAGTGYTGEDGIEIAVPAEVAGSLWDALVAAGAVPAGLGATAFVDAADVGAIAAEALLDPLTHANTAVTVTGNEALTYEQIAQILSVELGRPIRYARSGIARYIWHARRTLGMPWGMVLVTAAIYTTARLGRAAKLSDEVRAVLGRDPIGFADFAHRERNVWTPVSTPTERRTT